MDRASTTPMPTPPESVPVQVPVPAPRSSSPAPAKGGRRGEGEEGPTTTTGSSAGACPVHSAPCVRQCATHGEVVGPPARNGALGVGGGGGEHSSECGKGPHRQRAPSRFGQRTHRAPGHVDLDRAPPRARGPLVHMGTVAPRERRAPWPSDSKYRPGV